MVAENINGHDLEKLLYACKVEQQVLKDIDQKLNQSGIYYRSFARIKNPYSLAKKLRRKDKQYQEEGKRLQDLIGVRIVLYYKDDINFCRALIKEWYDLREDDSAEDHPTETMFCPTRMNLVCTLPERYAAQFSQTLFQEYRIDKTFEIQLRTILSEGWHEVEHDVRYKYIDEWQQDDIYKGFGRELNGVVATLEVCDNSMLNILDRLTYKCYKGGKLEEMLRYKFRIHFTSDKVSDDLMKLVDQDIRKKIYRIDREAVLICISANLLPALALTMDNVIYVCNELFIHDERIAENMPMLVREYMDSYRQGRLSCEEI